MKDIVTLDGLTPGERGFVIELHHENSMRRRLMDIGLIEGTEVACVGESPAGDPKAYQVRGAVMALRCADGQKITVRRLREP